MLPEKSQKIPKQVSILQHTANCPKSHWMLHYARKSRNKYKSEATHDSSHKVEPNLHRLPHC